MEVRATHKLIKGSVQKINIVANLIRGTKVDSATLQLRFCKRKPAKYLNDILKSAISNAQNNFGLDIDNLYVKTVMVGKSTTLKRSVVRARGRVNSIVKPFSRVTIIVDQR